MVEWSGVWWSNAVVRCRGAGGGGEVLALVLVPGYVKAGVRKHGLHTLSLFLDMYVCSNMMGEGGRLFRVSL